MRTIIAGFFVFAGLLVAVGVLGSLGIFDAVSPPIVGIGLALFMLALCGVSLWLFNPQGFDPLGRKTAEQHMRELEEAGLLVSSDFQATRAFGVEEFEDEGLHYFLELVDGRVLFLSGQYLNDYEPISDQDVHLPRRFPCTDFTVRRHKTEGYVAEITCRGAVLEPQVMAPSFSKENWQRGNVPEDGQIISDVTYEELKSQLVSSTE